MAGLGAATLGAPPVAGAQPRSRLVGVLMGFAESDPNAQQLVTAFKESLAQLGWSEGGSYRMALRWGAGNPQKMAAFARELVELGPDLLVVQTTPVLRAVAALTQSIPIVFAVVSDPIGGGFAQSLTHPGGNVTGFTDAQPAMGGKWVQLLKEVAPGTQRTALLFNPATAPPMQFYLPSLDAAAASLAVEARRTPVSSPEEIEPIVAAQAKDAGGSVIVMPDGFNTTHRDLIIGLMARHRVPAIYFNRYFAESGGLVGYGVDYAALFRNAALCRPHPQRREARRPADPAAEQVRARNQRQDRGGLGLDHAGLAAGRGRQGDRMSGGSLSLSAR